MLAREDGTPLTNVKMALARSVAELTEKALEPPKSIDGQPFFEFKGPCFSLIQYDSQERFLELLDTNSATVASGTVRLPAEPRFLRVHVSDAASGRPIEGAEVEMVTRYSRSILPIEARRLGLLEVGATGADGDAQIPMRITAMPCQITARAAGYSSESVAYPSDQWEEGRMSFALRPILMSGWTLPDSIDDWSASVRIELSLPDSLRDSVQILDLSSEYMQETCAALSERCGLEDTDVYWVGVATDLNLHQSSPVGLPVTIRIWSSEHKQVGTFLPVGELDRQHLLDLPKCERVLSGLSLEFTRDGKSELPDGGWFLGNLDARLVVLDNDLENLGSNRGVFSRQYLTPYRTPDGVLQPSMDLVLPVGRYQLRCRRSLSYYTPPQFKISEFEVVPGEGARLEVELGPSLVGEVVPRVVLRGTEITRYSVHAVCKEHLVLEEFDMQQAGQSLSLLKGAYKVWIRAGGCLLSGPHSVVVSQGERVDLAVELMECRFFRDPTSVDFIAEVFR